MSVRPRTWKTSKGKSMTAYQVDITHTHPDGGVTRIQQRPPPGYPGRKGAERWEREQRAELLARDRGYRPQGEQEDKKKGPKIKSLFEVWLERHSVGGGLTVATVRMHKRHCELYIVPAVGEVRVGAVKTGTFHQLREWFQGRLSRRDKPYDGKTINNVMSTLSALVKAWHEWEDLPCPAYRIPWIKTDKSEAKWWTPEEYELLVAGAGRVGSDTLVVVLLGGDAGLRMGEIRALRREDVLGDRLWIQRSRDTEEDIEHSTKGRRARMVPMTSRLREALKALPAGLQDTHILLDRWGVPLTPKEVRGHVLRAEEEAGLSGTGSCHRLRHTFCSMLAMAGVPARTLQELAGHESITTSQRYMHHAPSAGQNAVAALEKMHAQRDMSVTWLGSETKTAP